jgi:RNA polymerase sigma-70 factor, ECF subfamily
MTQRAKPATSGDDWDWEKVRELCLRETRRLLGPSAEADDAAQEATLRAWRHRGRCRSPDSPESWLRTIARREALRTMVKLGDVASENGEFADTRQDVPDLIGRLDVRRAVRGLNSQERRLLIGHYWQDLPDSELAMQLGLAEATVRVKLHRLRRRLRDTLVEA